MTVPETPAPGAVTAGLKAPAPGGIDPGADADQILKGNANVRSLLQRTGVALGAAATVVLGGLGYTQLHQIFPIPANVESWTKVALLAAVVSAVVGSAWLAVRFLSAQRQILLGTDSDGWIDVTKGEEELVTKVLCEHAMEEQAPTLLDVELRSLRLERVARRLAARRVVGRPKEIQNEADRLSTVVRMALLRGSGKLLQERSRSAFRGRRTALALGLAAGGIAATFAFADYYAGERELPAKLAACAKQETEVPEACAPFETSSEKAKRHKDFMIQVRKALNAVAIANALPLTPVKRRLLTRVEDCKKVISKLKTPLSDDARAATIALCAVKKG
jgi:hypothetical protein